MAYLQYPASVVSAAMAEEVIGGIAPRDLAWRREEAACLNLFASIGGTSVKACSRLTGVAACQPDKRQWLFTAKSVRRQPIVCGSVYRQPSLQKRPSLSASGGGSR